MKLSIVAGMVIAYAETTEEGQMLLSVHALSSQEGRHTLDIGKYDDTLYTKKRKYTKRRHKDMLVRQCPECNKGFKGLNGLAVHRAKGHDIHPQPIIHG